MRGTSAQSSSLISAGRRQTEARETANSRHCRDTGSAGASRSTRPRRSARLICRAYVTKIVFDLQLANLPVQNINLRCAGRILRCGAAAFENARRSVQQLLLPGVDLVRVNPVRARQLGDGPVALDRRQRHLGLERRPVLLACLLHVPLPRLQRFLGAGLHLNQLSRFRGPAQNSGSIVASQGTAIVVTGDAGTSLKLVNTGNIVGGAGTAVTYVPFSGGTITQSGGTIDGTISLSGLQTVLNVTGGAINGSIRDQTPASGVAGSSQNRGGLINFDLGSGSFTTNGDISVGAVDVRTGTLVLGNNV